MAPTAAVFLDRDNTLIHNDGDLGDPDQVRLIKGAASAIASLRGLGYKIVVVTNQGGVARGKFKEEDVKAVNNRIEELVKATTGAPIDRFYYCPYHPKGRIKKYKQEHPWRKPKPGMLLQAAQDLKLDLRHSWLIGDQLRDTEAAAAAGVRAVLLSDEHPSGALLSPPKQTPKDGGDESNDAPSSPHCWVAPTLIEAVRIIAQQGKGDPSAEPATPTITIHKRDRKEAVEKTATPASPSPRRVEPVEEPASPQASVHHAAPAHSRPFRPWLTQPADDSLVGEEEPAADSDHGVCAAHGEDEAVEGVQGLAADTAFEGDEGEQLFEGASQQQAEVDGEVPQQIPLRSGSARPIDQVLRQILQELRNQRAVESDFSFQNMLAIVFQMVAAVCLLAGLWMGGANMELFLRWISVGVLMEIATIAMLLFRRL